MSRGAAACVAWGCSLRELWLQPVSRWAVQPVSRGVAATRRKVEAFLELVCLGARVGEVASLVELLRDVHGLVGREAQVLRGKLLQLHSRQRHRSPLGLGRLAHLGHTRSQAWRVSVASCTAVLQAWRWCCRLGVRGCKLWACGEAGLVRVAHGGDYGGVTLDTELVEQQGRQTVEEPVARLGTQGGGAWDA